MSDPAGIGPHTPICSIPELVPHCRACPSDWTVQDHLGREVYIRFRWGHLRVSVRDAEELLSLQHSDPYDGIMDSETMIRLTAGVIDWLPHRIHYPPS